MPNADGVTAHAPPPPRRRPRRLFNVSHPPTRDAGAPVLLKNEGGI